MGAVGTDDHLKLKLPVALVFMAARAPRHRNLTVVS